MGFVRRPDFLQPGSALGDDIRHAERTANLDQLSARRDHVSPASERTQTGQDRRGAIIHHHCRFGARQLTDQGFNMGMPGPAFAIIQIHLQRRIIGGNLGHRVDGFRGEASASEICMDDHARRIDGAAQGGCFGGNEFCHDFFEQALRRYRLQGRPGRGSDLGAGDFKLGADSIDHDLAAVFSDHRRGFGGFQQCLHLGKASQLILHTTLFPN